MFTLLLTGVGGMCLSVMAHYFAWYPAVPLFFYLYGMLSFQMVRTAFAEGGSKVAGTYLLVKIIKFLLSVLIILAYGFGVGHDVVAFAGIFIVYYIAFLVFETRFFFCLEAKLKTNK